MSPHFFYKQQGVTLIVALVMLLVLSMVGVTISKDATIQERMSSNNQQGAIARLNAQSALIAAEQYLVLLGVESEIEAITTFNTTDGLYVPLARRPKEIYSIDISEPDKDMTQPGNWSDANSIAVANTPAGFTQSRFLIEYIGYLNDEAQSGVASIDEEDKNKSKLGRPLAFRITAIGYGVVDNNASILQSIYTTKQSNL